MQGMKDEKITPINYIFFLQTKLELDNNFYVLSDVLSKININLLPIAGEDLKVLDKNKKQYLVVIRNDLSSAFSFNEVRKSFLNSAMSAGRISLFDINSFSEIEDATKYQNKNMYRNFQLPQNLKQVAMTIAVDFFSDKNTTIEWPGGRRSKLPSMNNES